LNVEYVNKFWEDILLALISEKSKINKLLVGIRLKKSNAEKAMIELWTRKGAEKKEYEVKEWFVNSLGLSNKLLSRLKYKQRKI